MSNQVKNEGNYIGADLLDAVYGDADCNEAMAADVMLFDDDDLTSPAGSQRMHARNSSFMSSFTFHAEDGDFGDEFDCSSSAEDLSDDSNSQTRHDDDKPWSVLAPRLCSRCHSGMHA
jgi:hypothetical protein